MDGNFLLSNGSCLPCNCSGVTNSCMLYQGSQEMCNCTQGYTGFSCEVKFNVKIQLLQYFGFRIVVLVIIVTMTALVSCVLAAMTH